MTCFRYNEPTVSEPSVDNLLTVAQAIALIDGVVVEPRKRTVAIAEAQGFILADDLHADRDYPPFDKSLMDGYAIVCGNSDERKLVGEVAAGGVRNELLSSGEAVAIMTGAPIPPGADGVIPVENAIVAGDTIRFRADVTPGRYIARRGSDCRQGDTVLAAGSVIGPAQLAVAASVGATSMEVFARPRAAVLSTGDEIVPIHADPGPSQIRNSNSPMLRSLLQRLGCETIDLGHVRDEPALIRNAIELGLQHDLLFVTGGMSMGKYDYVPRVLREIGVQLHVTKLRIKPGKPFVFGSRAGRFVFGLPGNPVSAFVCTLRLASRLIARLRGERVGERWIDAELETPLPANGPREFYQPAMLVQTGNRTLARPLGWKGSADVFTLARADALLVRPADDPQRLAGSRVQLLEVPR
jgi:molybdopterin molybdotransferase